MAKFFQNSYYSLKGERKIIDLGEFSHGEWIVYEDCKPVFYINLHTENKSDVLINSLINTKKETIDTIITKVNQSQGTKLHLNPTPLFGFIKEVKSIELDLFPLPEHWIKTIT